VLFFSDIKSYAQKDWNKINRSNMVSEDTISRKGFTLVFLNKDSDFAGRIKQRLIDAFFSVAGRKVLSDSWMPLCGAESTMRRYGKN
jgi:hypothetical protein